MRLHDKVALITGSSRGIGRAIALRFAQEGAKIVVHHGHNDDEVAGVVAEIQAMGRDALAMTADVSSAEQVKRLVEVATGAFGRLDIWVNNAGAATMAEFSGERLEEKLRRLLDVDVKGTFLCCRAVTPVMQAQGSGCIINMSWDRAISGGMAGAEATIFAAAKGAVHSLSLSLARELAPTIRVNVIAPGWIDEGEPSGQAGEPADVAGAALYLASPEASFVTGQVIVVNGGAIMHYR